MKAPGLCLSPLNLFCDRSSLQDGAETVCSTEGENPAEEEEEGKPVESGRPEARRTFCGRKDLASTR